MVFPGCVKLKGCSTSDTSLTCDGFEAYELAVSFSGLAQVAGREFHALLTGSTDNEHATSGSVFSQTPLALRTSSNVVPAFEAFLKFQFESDSLRMGRGLAFVLTADLSSRLGAPDRVGYGGAFPSSIAVEFRRSPGSCVALSFGGVDAKDYCAASDALYGIPSGQEWASGADLYAWITWDSISKYLQVFLSSTSTRPTVPILNARINVLSALGLTGAGKAFAGVTAGKKIGGIESHSLYSFSFRAVNPGEIVVAPLTSSPKCSIIDTIFTCDGFTGRSPLLKFNGAVSVLGPLSYPLLLTAPPDQWTASVGSAFTTTRLPLGKAGSKVASFEIAMSFRITGGLTGGSRGLALVLTGGVNTAIGSSSRIGYGGSADFNKSLAVEFRQVRQSCVAISSRGVDAGDNCAGSPVRYIFNTGEEWKSGATQYAWVRYNGTSTKLEVWLSTVNAKPSKPLISTTSFDVLAVLGTNVTTGAFLGFTAGHPSTCCTGESHEILSITYTPEI